MNPKTAAAWLEAKAWLDRQPSAPRILAQEAAKHASKALRKAIPAKARIRLPRGLKIKTPQRIKKDLKKELEALCKAIVFTRDCGAPEAREGVCITCREWRVLQWGHFIPQNHSKWLQYDPRNTGGQCAGCNGPGGRGRPLEYAKAIDARDGAGAADRLQFEAQAHKWWRPNKTALQAKLDELRKLYPWAVKGEAAGSEATRPHPSLPSPHERPPE